MRGILKRPLAFALAAACVFGLTPPLPKATGPILPAPDSAIFGAEDAAWLSARDYLEEEYFLSGEASLYEYDAQWNRRPRKAGIPYTTRVVIRRPRSAAKFSGNVQFECAHPQLHNTSSWRGMRHYFARHGDIYAGVMCGADQNTRSVPKDRPPTATPWLLKWFDAQRYASVDWPDDDGIRYDVIGQVGALLKSGALLKGYKIERLYNSGWSFTGSQLRTYINEGFHQEHRMPGGQPIFDAYLIGISASAVGGGYNPLNNDQRLPLGNPRRFTKSIDVPVVEMLSEHEAPTNTGPQAPESDAPDARHRLYEVPGLSHGDGLGSRINGQWHQLSRRGHPNAVTPPECDLKPSDVPMGDLGAAVLDNLDRWVRRGVPPPRAPRMLREKDEWGNTKGGLRPAQLDVPLASYGDYGKESKTACQAPGPYTRIRRVPLDAAQLAQLHGSRPGYLKKFEARIRELVKQRWLLPEDGRRQIDEARSNAASTFSKK